MLITAQAETDEAGTRCLTEEGTTYAVSLIFILFTCVGMYDFLMIMSGDTAYIVNQFGKDSIAYFKDYPLWLAALFDANVCGGFFGGVLVFFRSPKAVSLTVAARAAMTVLNLYTFSFYHCWEMQDSRSALTDLSALGVDALFLPYLVFLRKKGFLKERFFKRENGRSNQMPSESPIDTEHESCFSDLRGRVGFAKASAL